MFRIARLAPQEASRGRHIVRFVEDEGVLRHVADREMGSEDEEQKQTQTGRS
jgi:hypothetical protein